MSVDVGSYDGSIASAREQAREFVFHRLSQMGEGLTGDEVLRAAAEALEEAYGVYGDLGASLAADLYDQIVSLAGKELDPAQPVNEYPDGEPWAYAGYAASKELDGDEPDEGAFADMIAAKAAQRVTLAANRTVEENAGRERDRDAGIRWARVPTGKNPCGFCIVMASRGFVYSSQAAAGDGLGPYNSYHDHCTCKAIPGFDGMQLDGYDDAGYLKQYEAAAGKSGSTDIGDIAKAIDKANGRQAHKKKK